MNQILLQLKQAWVSIAMFVAWILTITSAFIINPPIRDFQEETIALNTTSFLIAAFTALIIIPIKHRSRRKDYRLWFRASIVLIFLALISIAAYFFMLDKLSVPFYDDRLVKGANMYPEMQERRNSIEVNRGFKTTEEEFVRMCAGRMKSIWPHEEVDSNFYKLSSLYILTITLVSFFMISILQSIRCHEKP